MENARKNLKDYSILILIFTAVSFVRLIVEVFMMDFNMDALPEGATAGLVLAAQIAFCVVSFILLLPQIFIGVRGFKISKNPDHSKAHIVWATILTVLSVMAILSSGVNMIQTGKVGGNLFELADMVIDTVLYIVYIRCAKQVLKAA